MKRKNYSLYGKYIQEALQKEQQTCLKSEELPAYLPFYVNLSLIDEIHNNSNHLIAGRRGTGKTHLLGAFDESINSSDNNEISIMISIMELSQTPPTVLDESSEFTSKKVAREMFQVFLKAFFNQLLDKVDKYLECKLRHHLSKKEYKDIKSDTDTLLTRLLEAIELGRAYHVKKIARKVSNHQSDEGGSIGGKAQLGFNNLKPTVGLGISMNGNVGSKNGTETKVEIDSLLSIDLSEIRDLTIKIIEKIKLKVLYILIDEWMELDKGSSFNIQAIFAQLLKTVFFNHKHISVKIASVWHETVLYDKKDLEKSKGIQLGHDIQIGVDLDTAFLANEKRVFSFCKGLLFKRLSYNCDKVKELQTSDGMIDDRFIIELFDNKSNFKAFIAASHGIPRDLMSIFQKCSLRIRRDFKNNCIDYKLISDVSKDIYRMQKRKAIDPSSISQKLLNLINSYLEGTGRRLFLVDHSNITSLTPLRKLVDEELIHPIPSAVTHRKIRETYRAYHIDYGNFADWIETEQKDIKSLLDESVLAYFSDEFINEINSYILDASSVIDNNISCDICRFAFSYNNPVYIKASICPRCGADFVVNANNNMPISC